MGYPAVAPRSYQQLVRRLTEDIHSGRLARGAKLPTERELGESFGVSRAVVREAVKVLNAIGLVESRQGSGSYVSNNPIPVISQALTLSVTPEEGSVLLLFEFREALETLAARCAAERAGAAQREAIAAVADATRSAANDEEAEAFGRHDTAFHLLIGEASGNHYLNAVLHAVRHMHIDVARLIAKQSGSLAIAAEQHRRIAAAIAAGEAEEAARRMAAHVHYSADALKAIMATAPTPGRAP